MRGDASLRERVSAKPTNKKKPKVEVLGTLLGDREFQVILAFLELLMFLVLVVGIHQQVIISYMGVLTLIIVYALFCCRGHTSKENRL